MKAAQAKGQVLVEITDHKGRRYDTEFFVRTHPSQGPGHYVFGRSATGVVRLVARPDVKARRNPLYNIGVRRGWKTKREAQKIADALSVQFNVKVPVPLENQTHKWAGGYVGYEGGGCGDVMTITMVGHQIISDKYLEHLARRDAAFGTIMAALHVAQGFVRATSEKTGFGQVHTLVEIDKAIALGEKL